MMQRCVNIIILILCSIGLLSCEDNHSSDLNLRKTYLSPMLFEILGYMDDYLGRKIKEGTHVEHFYEPEKAAADEFEKLLCRFKENYHLHTEIERRECPPDQGGHIDFYSKEIADIINGCYILTSDGYAYDPDDDTRKFQMYKGKLDITLFEKASDEEKMSYLKGVYMRYGQKNSFRFANSADKIFITYPILMQLGCEDVRIISWVSPEPTSTCITFWPSDKVRNSLGITSSYYQSDIYDAEPNDFHKSN